MDRLVNQRKESEFSSEGRILSKRNDTIICDADTLLWATESRKN